MKSRESSRRNRLLAATISVFMVLGLVRRLDGQSVQLLRVFPVGPSNPRSSVVEGGDGYLYGTTSQGGNANGGTVFRVRPDGSGFSVVHAFAFDDGTNPQAGVSYNAYDGYLYGTTLGGSTGYGTVFRIMPDGSDFSVVHAFRVEEGANPYAGVIYNAGDGYLYGTTYQGGTGYGSVFRVRPDRSGFSVVHAFSNSDGARPYAGVSFAANDGFLYGTTMSGGNGYGTVFKVMPDGSDFAAVHMFSDSESSGPLGGVVGGGDGYLYGTTTTGIGLQGSVFRVRPDGSAFSTVHMFSWISDGGTPYAGVTDGGDGFLYGTTSSGGMVGGNIGKGTVFRVKPDGTAFSAVYVFSGADGAAPFAGVSRGSDGRLYGTTSSSGPRGAGTVFRLEDDGTGFSTVFPFFHNDGANPRAALIDGNDGYLYGTTYASGTGGYGTLFKVRPDGSGFATVHAFSYQDGANPSAGVINGGDGYLYGTTSVGGSGGKGTVFKVKPDGTSFSSLYSFSGPDGATPSAGLIRHSDGFLYGTTFGGGSGSLGTVFKVRPDGTSFEVIHPFQAGSDGAQPQAGLIDGADGYLYGTAGGGGGTVFRVRPDGTDFLTLHSFFNTGGEFSAAGVVSGGDGYLYGTTVGGGSGLGSLFRLRPDGTEFATVHSFNGSDGRFVWAGVVGGSDGYLYGTASSGGAGNFGTVFRLKGDGSNFSVVHSFSGNSGAGPYASVLNRGDGYIYGTTQEGGAGTGVLFRIRITDSDGDGIFDTVDNCPSVPNAGQADTDHDGLGEACDVCPLDPRNDVDNDGLCANVDNCPDRANANQADADQDGIGDACDPCPLDPMNDSDRDGRCADNDNCPVVPNPSQANADGDAVGDACDNCPSVPNGQEDTDADLVGDACDNCPDVYNPDQADSNGNGVGDACEEPTLQSTTTVLSRNRNPALTTQPAMFTAAIVPASPASGAPTGEVEFFSDGVSMGKSPVFLKNGQYIAVRGSAQLLVGPHTIAAQYLGDASFEASSSSEVTQFVNPGSYFGLDLGALGGIASTALAINESGQVTGWATLPGNIDHPFLYSDGVMTDLLPYLAPLGGTAGQGRAINASGQVAGFVQVVGNPGPRGFLYSGGSAVDLGTLGGGTQTSIPGGVTAGHALSDSGYVTGLSITSSDDIRGFLYFAGQMADMGTLGSVSIGQAVNEAGLATGYSWFQGSLAHAFLYANGAMNDLGTLGGSQSQGYDINALGQVVGFANVAGDATYHAFLYSGSQMFDLGTLTGTQSYGYAINDAGQVAGMATLGGDSVQRAFLYSGGPLLDLGALGGRVAPFALSQSGQVVGLALTATSAQHAFAYTAGQMVDLGTIGFKGSVAYAVNSSGLVAGYVVQSNGRARAALWTPVPASTLTVAFVSVPAGGTATLSATLSSAAEPVVDKTVTFTLNGQPAGSGVTDASGVATSTALALLLPGVYSGGVTAAFAGDSTLGPSSGAADLSVMAGSVSSAERSVLVALYNNTNGPGWFNQTNWLGPDGTECLWAMVTCDASAGTVVDIYSDQGNNLNGTLPPELGNLTNLQGLRLARNNLVSFIPSELGSLSHMRSLLLYQNQLTGPIPGSLGNLVELQAMDLSYNSGLGGSIPPEFGSLSSLTFLSLAATGISGQIPASLGNATALVALNLSATALTGTIPPELGNLSSLQQLYITGTQVTGSIPEQLTQLPIVYMSLEGNQLGGSIPAGLWSMQGLGDLDLRNNHLSGAIPPAVGQMTGLWNLRLSGNQLSGVIPAELGNLSSLGELLLDGNAFAGALPAELANLYSLYWLTLDWNALYSTDPNLTSFLNGYGPWEASQTVAPTNVSTSGATASLILVSWTPITYVTDTGFYQVFYSTTPGGPYTAFATTTADKSASSLAVTGLQPGTTYYFVLRTTTLPNANNQNTIVSEQSVEVSATTLHTLTIAKTGTSTGIVTSSPAGIDCGATCSASLSGDVTLTPIPDSTAVFGGWSGDCSGGPVTIVTMDADKTCSAAFNTKPDLVESGVGAPPSAGIGTTIPITDTVKNQGGGPAYPGTSTTTLWLSADAVLDAGDTLLGSRAVPSLIPGATSFGPSSVSIPASTAPGLYVILAVADADGSVPESNESNNVGNTSINITGPDLTVQSLGAPGASDAGQTISVSDTTKAAGGGAGAAPASTTSFYISTDAILDGTDALIGSRPVPALAPGTSSAGPAPATLPGSIPPGSYSIIAKADGPGLIAETVETNNTLVAAILIGPDLVISQLQGVPGNARPEDTLNVKPKTKNVGGATAAATTTKIYLRPPSGPDVFLGSYAVGSLAPGITHLGTLSVTIPASTPPGPNYAIVAVADDGNAVAEALETNNTALKTFKVN